MIPKVIHYCWFGRGEKSKLIKKCIKSWHKYCPDYEIIEWNEDNFDINCNTFVKQAYEAKKWAFVSDYVRLFALYNYGGVYLDTDVEIIKPIDTFLNHEAFSGFENPKSVPTGIIAAQKEQSIIKLWFDWYKDREFIVDGKMLHEPNVKFMTQTLLNKGLILNNTYQEIEGFAMYPQTYFCPINVDQRTNCKSKNTYAIHHFTSSWRSKTEMKKFKKAKRRQAWWYYKNLMILPQKIVRFILGNEKVEKIKNSIKTFNN